MAAIERLAIIVLYHTVSANRLADHNITKSNIGIIVRQASSNTDYQAKTNRVEAG